tara:strand:- start:262 stop:657 length:396 start_codon:yes stop_codon:yes gene_type:complete
MGRVVTKDHFIENDFTGESYAGEHFILDVWGFDTSLRDIDFDKILLDASNIAGANRLYGHVHKFNDGGLSGVAVLEESHITFHTWPDREFVAFDIFMCGDTQPELAVEHIKKMIKAKKSKVQSFKRGVVNE